MAAAKQAIAISRSLSSMSSIPEHPAPLWWVCSYRRHLEPSTGGLGFNVLLQPRGLWPSLKLQSPYRVDPRQSACPSCRQNYLPVRRAEQSGSRIENSANSRICSDSVRRTGVHQGRGAGKAPACHSKPVMTSGSVHGQRQHRSSEHHEVPDPRDLCPMLLCMSIIPHNGT